MNAPQIYFEDDQLKLSYFKSILIYHT